MECNGPLLFNETDNDTLRFISQLESFQLLYSPIHGTICVVLCIFGLVTNAVHIAVLSRPAMRTSAVNCLLTAVAVCDVGTMASYLVYLLHFIIRKNANTCSPTYTHGWMQFLLWHVVLSITLHTTSLWLAVAMAFIRRMTLRIARLNSKWQRPEFAWKICIVTYGIVFVASAPNSLVHDIEEFDGYWKPPEHCQALWPTNYTEKMYTFKLSNFTTENDCRLFKWNLWLIGIFFKVIPCILLFALSIGLMSKLREAEHKRRKLTNASAGSGQCKKTKTDRTTVMLIVILIVFLITELPQGIISILCALYPGDVFRRLIFNLGDVLDLLSLLNSSVNFVLYCVMSSRYRKTFWTVILPPGAYKYFMSRANTTSNFNLSHQSRIPSIKTRQCCTISKDVPLRCPQDPIRSPPEYSPLDGSVRYTGVDGFDDGGAGGHIRLPHLAPPVLFPNDDEEEEEEEEEKEENASSAEEEEESDTGRDEDTCAQQLVAHSF